VTPNVENQKQGAWAKIVELENLVLEKNIAISDLEKRVSEQAENKTAIREYFAGMQDKTHFLLGGGAGMCAGVLATILVRFIWTH
jgi:hypothetical protein